MKKYGDLPVYFIIIGLILNIITYFIKEVPFIELMIRSMIITVLFAGVGCFLATVLGSAHTAVISSKKQGSQRENQGGNTSTIDIRVNTEDDEDLLKFLPQSESDEFVEVNPESFKRFMDKD